MVARITTLIDKQDNAEIMRDEIAAIIALESAGQISLAHAAAKEDVNQWKLRVYVETSNPIDEWTHGNEVGNVDRSPVVAVSLESESFDPARSDLIERQMATGIYNVDCYGYGISAEKSGGGHYRGDTAAMIEAQRTVRLVRNILMSSVYTYLGHQGLVAKRFVNSITYMQPEKNGKQVDHVCAGRIVLAVDFNEFSPQYVGQPLELISAQITRASDGMLLTQADIEIT